MPFKSKEDRLAWQRENYKQRKTKYVSNPSRAASRAAGMAARKEILDASFERYVSPSEVLNICAAHVASTPYADMNKSVAICTRTLVGALVDGVFIGSVLFGSALSRGEKENQKIKEFHRLIKTPKFRKSPEILILHIETEEIENGRKSIDNVWRRAPHDYRHHRWLEKR